ncbi:MAG: altronate dehydratase family protein [Lachnospiraceae bacterium]|nr:altronate dehydratase family protein [Lachnospiraceae bacterium]
MDIIVLNSIDNVAVALNPLTAGQEFFINNKKITAAKDIAMGHKIALFDIPIGKELIKYGYSIGIASIDIKAGDHVHSHNLKTNLSDNLEYTYAPAFLKTEASKQGDFMGFKRPNGKVGIRNEIWIIPTVGCVNSIGNLIAIETKSMIKGSVTGVYCFPHPYGCSQLGEDHENTQKALSGLINHPNAGGVLVLGLGCENNSIAEMRAKLGDFDENRIKFLNCQDYDDEIKIGIDLINELITIAQNDTREQVSTSELIIGLKCGGSDGLSGITANPLVGAFTNRIITEGGSAILTEVPEMFGAETILMNRCKDEKIFKKTVNLINNFKDYFRKHNQPIYENPSPGNKEGGITTLEDKALGCTQKAGTATVVDVLDYGEALTESGLNLLNSPGNDLVASTALAAGGAHIIMFTTGRGTPFGSPVPTIKISSNTALYEKKQNWIDFDAGSIATGASIDDVTAELYTYIIKLANGEQLTKTEQNEIRDMAIFRSGVTL